MAVVDSNNDFLYVHVGKNGRVADGGVWGNCSLATLLNERENILPPAENMPRSEMKLPYVFVADDAFPLKKFIMKPFPFRNQSDDQRIFSYRLSRARRTVENAFGTLCNKFRVLLTSKVEKIILATVVLHNYVRRTFPENNNHASNSAAFLREQRDASLIPLEGIQRRPTQEARDVREGFMRYFTDEGAVYWQNEICGI